MISRRDAVQRVGLLLGMTVMGSQIFLSGCKTSDYKKGVFLTAEEVEMMDEIGETILPATPDSPGAKSIQIGTFADMMANDCYKENQKEAFKKGFSEINDRSKKAYDKSFMELTPVQRTELLTTINGEMHAYHKQHKEDKGENEPHYFQQMKQLTLLGYFTSETGATKALRYVETPGKFDGAFPYKKGDRAWALS